MKFLFTSTSGHMYNSNDNYKSKLEDFKFEEVVDEAGNDKTYIEINSIEDLVKLGKAVDCELIVIPWGKKPSVEVYDDWRE